MNLEQFKTVEKIKYCYLRYRGDLTRISEELNIPYKTVVKYVNIFKKKEERDVSKMVSNSIMQHLLFGYESRVANLMDMLKNLQSKDSVKVSCCCDFITKIEEGKTICLRCLKPCEEYCIEKENIYRLKKDIILELREEDKTFAEFAVSMGYTNQEKELPKNIVKVQQNVIMLGKDKLGNDLIADTDKLDPISREKLIKTIEAKVFEEGEIVNGEFGADKGENDES